MTISTLHVILLSLAVVLGFAFAAQGDLADQDHRNVLVNCSAAMNKESIDLFRKLESTTRLVYFTEENEGVDLVWAYSHAEPFFSLEEDFMRFAIVISKQLVVHINVNISINNCTLLNKTSTRYTEVVVEMFASALLTDVAELAGTVCYKTTKGKQQSYHCCRPGRDDSGKFTTVLCDLQERSIIWLKVLKVLIVVVVVILGYVYVPILTSRIFSHPPSRKPDTCPIELTSNDLEDCFYVYFQPCRTDCLHRVGQFLYGFFLVPFVVYVSLASYFTFKWPKFVTVFLEPYSLFCFTCYCLREALNFLHLEASEENAQHECLICRLWDEKPGDSSETITEQLKLLPRRIGKAGKCIYKTFCKCTVLSIPRECTMEYLCRFLLFLPLAFVCFAWFLLSVPSCILLALPAYNKVREGRYWWPLSHHKIFYDKSLTLKSIFVGVLEFFLNICACAGYVIIGSVTAYFLVHVSVYVIMLLTLDFDFLTYVVCLFLVVFYISYSVRSLAEKYGRLKLVIFECYKPSMEEDESVSDNGNYDEGGQDDEESIPGDLYLEVCKAVEPKFKNLFMMLLNLVIFLTFVFVVTACVIIFGPRPGGASGLVRSLIALLLGLSPKVTNMFSPSETDQEKERLRIKSRVKKQVQLYLRTQDTKASEEGNSFLSRRSNASLEYPHDWIELA